VHRKHSQLACNKRSAIQKEFKKAQEIVVKGNGKGAEEDFIFKAGKV